MGMKMAKASEADLKMAMNLGGVLDALGHRQCPCMPEEVELFGTGEDSEPFSRPSPGPSGKPARTWAARASRQGPSWIPGGRRRLTTPSRALSCRDRLSAPALPRRARSLRNPSGDRNALERVHDASRAG